MESVTHENKGLETKNQIYSQKIRDLMLKLAMK